ncbi:MAG: ComF family protein [Leptospiraceae bacterium]|nr:ComF family protein [Leptospiraceae bacterium]
MRILSKILHFFFPLNCYFCGREDFYSTRTGVCKSCGFSSNELHRIITGLGVNDYSKICDTCSSFLEGDSCNFCTSRNIFFTKLFFLRYRTNKEREILHAIKFEEKKFLSNYLRIGLFRELQNLQTLNLQGIVSVPSNKSSLRKRPYHVCEPVIKKLEKTLRIPVLPILVKNSKDLQSGKTFFNRFLHARFAFSIQKEYQQKLLGNYLLVDDLFTTGASINECARILLENGACQVYTLTLLKVK